MARSNGKSRASQFRIGYLVHDVSRLRRTVIDKALKPLGITRSQWWVLSNLARDRSHGMMQTELAKVLDIGKVALGGLIDRLEASGYVARKPDPVDRRAKRVEITKKGEKLLRSMEERGSDLNQDIQSDITSKELKVAEDVLYRMKKRLIEMDDEIKLQNGNRLAKTNRGRAPAL